MWWSRALIAGLTFGLLTGLSGAVFQHKDLKELVITGVVGGVFFGILMSVFTGRMMKQQQDRVGGLMLGLSADARIAARRASSRGAIPNDPQIRSAAAGLVRDQLNQLNRWGGVNLLIFGGLDLLYVGLAIWTSPWWWLAVAVFTGFLALQLWQPGHLRRRLARLAPGPIAVSDET